MAAGIAEGNRYPVKHWRKDRKLQANALVRREDRGKVPFCVPLISDDVSVEIRRHLRPADLQKMLRVTDVPSRSLKVQLVFGTDKTCSARVLSSLP